MSPAGGRQPQLRRMQLLQRGVTPVLACISCNSAVLISLQRDIAHSQSWSGQAATRWEYTYGSGAAHTCIAGALDRADRLPGSCVFCCRPVLQGCRSAVRRWRRDVVGPNVCQAPLPSTRLSRELPASRHSILRNGCLNESFFIIVRLVALS